MNRHILTLVASTLCIGVPLLTTGCNSSKVVSAVTGTPYNPAVSPGNNTLLLELQDATIIADDGTYLGKITTNKYDTDAIINPSGQYGSKYQLNSMLDPYGQYGSTTSLESPFCPTTNTPPRIVKDGNILGYVTVNTSIGRSINPYALLGMLNHG